MPTNAIGDSAVMLGRQGRARLHGALGLKLELTVVLRSRGPQIDFFDFFLCRESCSALFLLMKAPSSSLGLVLSVALKKVEEVRMCGAREAENRFPEIPAQNIRRFLQVLQRPLTSQSTPAGTIRPSMQPS